MSASPSSSGWSSAQAQGIVAALLSAAASGFVPIFGKQAFEAGLDPFAVVMLRTVGAAGALWLMYLLFFRQYIYIYPFAFVSCLAAGIINGLGSLLFYNSLSQLNASLSQLLFTLYLIFLTLFSWLDGYRLSRLTWVRLGLALAAVFLLKWSDPGNANWLAAFAMIAAGAMYGLHVWINQRTLYDAPAPTVTLYTLSGMATTVFVAYLFNGAPPLPTTPPAWTPVILLTLVTITARITLFVGVKQLGGMQAVLLNLSEAFVTILAAILLLNETFTGLQWLGTAFLALSVFLITREQALGTIPRPKPWLLIFTTWFESINNFINPSPPRPRKSIHPTPLDDRIAEGLRRYKD